MITPTNILLVNVAFADIISLIWCPIPLAINLSGKHVSGRAADLICKFFTGYAATCVTVSVTYQSLVVLALERYYAIVKPFKQPLVASNKVHVLCRWYNLGDGNHVFASRVHF